ncbi:MAG: NAD(P)-dependent oxidoreductase [Planctomycetales bacterium]
MTQVTITGVRGNLGWKLLKHLSVHPQVAKVIGLDLQTPSTEQLQELQQLQPTAKVEFTACELLDWNDRRWRDAIDSSDAVVHFAARNPFPEATWDEANASLDMTLNVTLAAVDAGVKRVIFVSSNHVMGRYLDGPLAASVGPGELTTDREHAVGTCWNAGERAMDSTPYAVAKSAGERVCHALARRSGGQTSFVCIRVGWCQPGENLPCTLSSSGTITQQRQLPDTQNPAEIWFRNMWLSNRDFTQVFEKGIFADSAHWPEPCVVVNGMSANSGMKWSLKEGREYLGYEPVDDVSR